MQHPAVHWANGIFLRPHHFQANDRHWNELVALQQRLDQPVGYGLHSVTISNEALQQGVLEIRGLKIRLKEGSIISDETADVHRISLPPSAATLLQQGQDVSVFVAVPMHREGQSNVATGDQGGDARFRERVLETSDESAGGDRQPLRLRDFNFRFLFSTDDRNGFETLPIAKLRRSSQGDESIVLDRDYYPSVLSIQAWPELAAIVRRIHDDVASRMKALGQQIREKRISFSSQTQGDLQKMMMLQSLNQAAGELAVLAFAPGMHPLTVYTALCRIIGQLSIFGPELIVRDVPHYDHDALAPLFQWAHKRIRELIFSIKDDEFQQRFFTGTVAHIGMRVQLEPEWFGPEWEWYFAVNPVNCSHDECLRILKGGVDWVLGSVNQVEQLFTLKAPGVTLKKLKQLPSALPAANWLYFSIIRDNDAWKNVQLDQSLAMRVTKEQITNLNQLEGQTRLKLNVGGTVYGLEFAIFAVRQRT